MLGGLTKISDVNYGRPLNGVTNTNFHLWAQLYLIFFASSKQELCVFFDKPLHLSNTDVLKKKAVDTLSNASIILNKNVKVILVSVHTPFSAFLTENNLFIFINIRWRLTNMFIASVD